jgi:plasmid stabilization system protein ParE
LTYALTAPAARDLLAILKRIRADNPLAADRMKTVFLKKFQLLALHPGIGTPFDEARGRVLTVPKNYLILYKQLPSGVQINRIKHARQA